MFGTDYKVEVSVVLGDRGRLYKGFRVMNCFAHRRGHFLPTDLPLSFILSFSISGTLQSGVVLTSEKEMGAGLDSLTFQVHRAGTVPPSLGCLNSYQSP